MSLRFKADSTTPKIVEAYALDAIDIAKQNFRVSLNWSEASVAHVEQILDVLHKSIASGQRPPEDTIWTFAKAFGSYVGEVFRKAHGGEWGMASLDGKDFTAFHWPPKDVTFWPWARAHKRIIGGPENNVWDYYRALRDGA